MASLLLSIKSTIQLSISVMISSESMVVEEGSRNDVRVSKHADLEANKRCEVGDLLIVSTRIGGSTSGMLDGDFSGLSLRLNANFGFVPVEPWFVCSFSKALSHDFSCFNPGHGINDHVKGIERDRYRFVLSLVVRGKERACIHELFSQKGQLG